MSRWKCKFTGTHNFFFFITHICHMPSCSKSCSPFRHFFNYFCYQSATSAIMWNWYLSNLYVFIDILPALFGLFSLDPPGFRWKNKQQFRLYGPRERKFRKQKERERERERKVCLCFTFLFYASSSSFSFHPNTL